MKSPRKLVLLSATLLLSPTITGCLVVRYSTGAGWSIWPGSVLLTVILVGLMLLLNRR